MGVCRFCSVPGCGGRFSSEEEYESHILECHPEKFGDSDTDSFEELEGQGGPGVGTGRRDCEADDD